MLTEIDCVDIYQARIWRGHGVRGACGESAPWEEERSDQATRSADEFLFYTKGCAKNRMDRGRNSMVETPIQFYSKHLKANQ
jgi:hypothetical protein